eukprot:7778242-Pyramimonas_sp.AAC.1
MEQLNLFNKSPQRLEDVEVRDLMNCSFLDERYNAAVTAVIHNGPGRSGEVNQPANEGKGKCFLSRELSDVEPVCNKVAALALPDEEEFNREQSREGWQPRMSSSVPIPLVLSPSSPSTSTSSSPESTASYGSTMSLIPSPLSPHRLRFRQSCNGGFDPSSTPPSAPQPLPLQFSRYRPNDVHAVTLNESMLDFSSTPALRAFGQTSASTSPYSRGALSCERRSLDRKPTDRKSLDRAVGSFEECVFAGRLALCGMKVPHVDGFTALLAVCGKGSSPMKKKLAFTAYYLPAEKEGRAPPYFASIAVDGNIGQYKVCLHMNRAETVALTCVSTEAKL